jgi:hypothetical protein
MSPDEKNVVDALRADGLSSRDLYPDVFPKRSDPCAFCGHLFSEHGDSCSSEPRDPRLDAGGECPCLGFERRSFPS